MAFIPSHWQRGGLILPRSASGPGSSVVGDPCIVWDDDIPGWRMFLFFDPPGIGEAVCAMPDDIGTGRWSPPRSLVSTNPEAILGGVTHKPWVVMDAHRPNRAARIGGRFCLLSVSRMPDSPGYHKAVQRAWAERLAGPWTWEPTVCIPVGGPDDFDAKHVDAVTGFFFPERDEFLYFYMGYPDRLQPYVQSPYGSAQGAATQRVGQHVTKLGVVLPPSPVPGHWASGWVGGLLILPGQAGGWIAVANASPTPPRPDDQEIFREEPPPSMGGFAVCDQPWPVTGWQWAPEPIEWMEDVPANALAAGEGTNLWRQHILVLHDGGLALFYNSGFYGQEQLYAKFAAR